MTLDEIARKSDLDETLANIGQERCGTLKMNQDEKR
jgi:hypothetical protein